MEKSRARNWRKFITTFLFICCWSVYRCATNNSLYDDGSTVNTEITWLHKQMITNHTDDIRKHIKFSTIPHFKGSWINKVELSFFFFFLWSAFDQKTVMCSLLSCIIAFYNCYHCLRSFSFFFFFFLFLFWKTNREC